MARKASSKPDSGNTSTATNGERMKAEGRMLKATFPILTSSFPLRACPRSGGKFSDISIYGQECNATTRRLAVMNLALRCIEADFGPEHADSFRRDLRADTATRVSANPQPRSHSVVFCEAIDNSSPTRPSTTSTLPCATAHSFKAKPQCRS